MGIEIEEGWRFDSADFSVRAARDNDADGNVLLVRDKESKAAWHRLPEYVKEDDDGPALYATGRGKTIEEAVAMANTAARNARPITESEDVA